jgi:hypothetical protein
MQLTRNPEINKTRKMKYHELLSLMANFANGIAVAIGTGLLGLFFLLIFTPFA